jgi:hypothetical protein
MIVRKITIIVVTAIISSSSHAQWTEPVTISDEGSGYRRPEAIANDDGIYIVYFELGNSPNYCYFSKGTDCGEFWQNSVVLSDSSDYLGEGPSIIRIGDTLHAVWRGFLPSENPQVFYRRSPDSGETWEDVQQITRPYTYMKYPDIAEINGKLVCLYNAMLHAYPQDTVFIMAVTSDDGGRHWNEPYRVRYDITSTAPMKLLENDGRLHLIYMTPGIAAIEVVCINSDDEGLTWSEPLYISPNDQYASQLPRAHVDSSGLLSACWMDYKYGSNGGIHGDILMNYSLDNGNTWHGEIRVTYEQSGGISTILSDVSNFYVAYDDIRDGNENIYFRSSADLGVTWSGEEQLTYGLELESIDPSLAISYCDQIKTIHLAWSQEYGHWERRINYSHREIQTGIDDKVTLPNIKTIYGVSIFPNPFNSNASIKFMLKDDIYIEISIYNILGEKAAEIYRGYLLSGPNHVSLSSHDYNLASGYYYISINSNEERIVKSSILIK